MMKGLHPPAIPESGVAGFLVSVGTRCLDEGVQPEVRSAFFPLQAAAHLRVKERGSRLFLPCEVVKRGIQLLQERRTT